MSRMRQVPVMDITQREMAMSRNQPVVNTRPAPAAVYCAETHLRGTDADPLAPGTAIGTDRRIGGFR